MHVIAGKNEALAWGKFRTGSVTIAGTVYMPPSSEKLPLLFASLINEIQQIVDISNFQRKNPKIGILQTIYDLGNKSVTFLLVSELCKRNNGGQR